MSKVKEKKRSTTKEFSMLTPPKGFDHKKYAGRWVAAKRLEERSDGYEPRGFSQWKDEKGGIVKTGDLVWCYMTREEAEERNQDRFDAAKEQMDDMIAQDQASDDRLNWELERVGGKLSSKISYE